MIGGTLRIAIVCVSSLVGIVWIGGRSAADSRVSRESPAKPPMAAGAIDQLRALREAHLDGEGLVATDASGRRIELSIDVPLQAHVSKVFADYQVPYGALVAIEPATGRVLAYVSHSSANPNGADLARDPSPPAASVFKLITSAALLDSGVTPDTPICYGGGSSRLLPIDLRDDRRRDGHCATLADAIGRSINAVVAKLADRHLDPDGLRRYAAAFGFGQRLPVPFELAPSPAEIPNDRLEFARTAAGFWHVHMSPLHAALIAASIANDGVMPSLTWVDRVVELDGRVETAPHAEPRNVVSAGTAHALGKMMLRCVHDGTARAAFLDGRGRAQVPGIDVAGKTGTLNSNDPFRAYSWWIGFAPAEKPRIALAALVVNTPTWRIKSSFVAREAMREYLITEMAPPSNSKISKR
jgi:cell division protein FtsI/penicillin-binding protein 2